MKFYPGIKLNLNSKRLRWAGHVVRIEEARSAFKILTSKATGNRSLERPRRRWEENIEIDPKVIGINTSN